MDGIQNHSNIGRNSSAKAAILCPYLGRKANRVKNYSPTFCIWQLFHVNMAKKTMVLGKTHHWTQPRKTTWGSFPKQRMAWGNLKMGTKFQARLGVQPSFVFACPWATNRWLKSQRCILVIIAVTWTGREDAEDAELPPVYGPPWSPAYEPGLLRACFARQQESHPRCSLLCFAVCSIPFFYIVRLSSSTFTNGNNSNAQYHLPSNFALFISGR